MSHLQIFDKDLKFNHDKIHMCCIKRVLHLNSSLFFINHIHCCVMSGQKFQVPNPKVTFRRVKEDQYVLILV